MGPIGAPEMIAIFIFALLLFGPKKLPELGRLLGKGLTEFRRAKNELKNTFDSHMQELEREARLSDEAETRKSLSHSTPVEEPSYGSADYPYPYDEYGQSPPASDLTSTQEATRESSHESGNESARPESHPTFEPVAGTVARSPVTTKVMPEPAAEPVHSSPEENRHSS